MANLMFSTITNGSEARDRVPTPSSPWTAQAPGSVGSFSAACQTRALPWSCGGERILCASMRASGCALVTGNDSSFET